MRGWKVYGINDYVSMKAIDAEGLASKFSSRSLIIGLYNDLIGLMNYFFLLSIRNPIPERIAVISYVSTLESSAILPNPTINKRMPITINAIFIAVFIFHSPSLVIVPMDCSGAAWFSRCHLEKMVINSIFQ